MNSNSMGICAPSIHINRDRLEYLHVSYYTRPGSVLWRYRSSGLHVNVCANFYEEANFYGRHSDLIVNALISGTSRRPGLSPGLGHV